ncbi:MAG: non-heme iron oxygenase ferredoxin subunit [Burkholderiales bacterium]|jgi:nitrite reductase/ring-hydroxylating ferredoxin subunit
MWVALCPTAEVPDDDVVEVVRDGHVFCAYRIAGRHHVTDGICTHAVARLAEGFVLDDVIECPMHNGRFHIPTGRVDGPPACEPLRTYPCRVEGGTLMVELPG